MINYKTCYWCDSPNKVYETRFKMLRYFCSKKCIRRFHSINYNEPTVKYWKADGEFIGILEFLQVFEDIPTNTVLDLEYLDLA